MVTRTKLIVWLWFICFYIALSLTCMPILKSKAKLLIIHLTMVNSAPTCTTSPTVQCAGCSTSTCSAFPNNDIWVQPLQNGWKVTFIAGERHWFIEIKHQDKIQSWTLGWSYGRWERLKGLGSKQSRLSKENDKVEHSWWSQVKHFKCKPEQR